jgi:hypothetical protein
MLILQLAKLALHLTDGALVFGERFERAVQPLLPAAESLVFAV